MNVKNTAATSTEKNSTPSVSARHRWWLLLALLLPLAAAGFWGWKAFKPVPARDFAVHSELLLDLRQPDALIESRSLATLPRDLLEIPLLHDTLTEDFVFYYENNPDRLGVSGSLRRIVYEHELQVQDTLINQIMDEPASVALWRGADGKLTHAMLLIKRNGLSALLELFARVALNDNQLSAAGLLRVDGDEVPLYRLRYAPGRTLLFAAVKDQLVVLSQPGMVLESNDASSKLAQAATESLEAVLAGDVSWAEHFGLDEKNGAHRITVSADYLSMGYRAFFPAWAGFSLEKNARGWQSQLAYDPVDDQKSLDFQSVWRGMPMGASACIAVPLAADVPQKLLQGLGATAAQQKLLAKQLQGPVGLCWYPETRLYTPLIVTRLILSEKEASGETEAFDAVVENLFEKVIGSIEPNLDSRRFPVQAILQDNGKRWQRQVGSNFGQYPAERSVDPSLLAGSGFFNVTLARHGDMLMFSLDDQLVKQAVATLDKRYPPLLDTLPQEVSVPAYLAPEKLAPLLRQEAMQSLPQSLEPVFRNAAETHLLPKLDALAGYGKYALTLPADTLPDERWQWLPITWKSL